MAEWVVANCDHAKLEANLPKYHSNAEEYKRTGRVTKAAKPQAQPTATPIAMTAGAATIAPTPAAQPVITAHTDEAPAGDAASELARIIQTLAGGAAVNEAQVRSICTEEVNAALARVGALPQQVHVTRTNADGSQTRTNMGVQHKQFADLLRLTELRDHNGYCFPIWLPGPAGSGKTTAAMKVAEALGVPFFHVGAVDTEYKLLGFRDASGRFNETNYYKAYGQPSVFLFDEIDASHPQAVVALNMSLENGHCDFAGENVSRDKDCIIIAAANTYGAGANALYVGRNQLDGATIDRFIMLAWDYDIRLEKALAGNDEWVGVVTKVRANCDLNRIKHVVSPRASIRGAAMLRQGWSKAQVVDMVLRKGMAADTWAQAFAGVVL
jgi:hypothetical protein